MTLQVSFNFWLQKFTGLCNFTCMPLLPSSGLECYSPDLVVQTLYYYCFSKFVILPAGGLVVPTEKQKRTVKEQFL